MILLPVVVLLACQTWQDARRASEMAQVVQLHSLALKAQEHYQVFSNGVANAVETSRISPAAVAALWDARHALDELGHRAQTAEWVSAAKNISSMAETLDADPRIPTVHRLRQPIADGHAAIFKVQAAYERQLNDLTHRSIDESVLGTQIVIMVSLVALLLTIWCVFRMIHYLSQPLALAVSIADRIADGSTIDEADFNLHIDVGNLIHSLGRMYRSQRTYQRDAEAHRRGLEEKIGQLAESQASLAEAQHLAQMGNWSWDRSLPLGRWSDETYRILGFEPGECEPHWRNYVKLVDVHEQDTLRSDMHRLLSEPGSFEAEHHITTPQGLYRVIHTQTSSRA
ncbi:MAG TPA: PAS domain-containing protein, partial [Burkholderiales bacterium]|nr:PAS domain-containing protein [Burkholderiales bacterium]